MRASIRVGVVVLAATALTLGLAASVGAEEQRFDFTGEAVTWTVPDDVCEVTVDAVGATGGAADGEGDLEPSMGGGGGRVLATIPVTPGETLTIVVGGAGGDGTTVEVEGYEPTGGAGGFNGGGDGGGAGSEGKTGGGGGGASDVRQASGGSGCVPCPVLPTGPGDTAADRVIVAGGGGGAGGWSGVGGASGLGTPGGAGGGESGGDPDGDGADGGFEEGNNQQGGEGGQAGANGGAGGAASDEIDPPANGGDGTTDGQGGDGGTVPNDLEDTAFSGGGGGGGGGYVGGGGGGAVSGFQFGTGGAGGGGSSYAGPTATDVTMTAGFNLEGDGYVILSWTPGAQPTCVPPVVLEPRFTG